MPESWLSVGGLRLHLRTDDPQLAFRAQPLSRPFLLPSSDASPADLTVHARFVDTPLGRPPSPRFEGGDAWLLHDEGEAQVITCCTHGAARDIYKQARVNATRSAVEVAVSRPHFADALAAGAMIDPLDYPLDEVLMILALARGRGVAVHACGLLDADGRAFVFAGQSGAGKSTLSRLVAGTPGFTVLSDERLVIRTDGETPTVYGTPWHGDALFVSPRSGPLAGLFFLRQAPRHAIVPLASPLAVAHLLACAFLPFHDRDAVEQTLAAIERAVHHAGASELQFAPDAAVVDVLPCRRR